MGEPADTRRPPSRPGRRDAFVVAVACFGVFVIGAATGAFDRLEPLIARADVGDETVAGVVFAAIGPREPYPRASMRAPHLRPALIQSTTIVA